MMISKNSSLLIGLIAVLAAVAIAAGIFFLRGNSGGDEIQTSIRPVSSTEAVVPAVGIGPR